MILKRIIIALGLCLLPSLVLAQGNLTCPTRPVNDNSNACASTAYVQNGTIPLNLISLGADPTGVVDATSILTSALATGKAIYAPKGTYKISGTCPSISTNGQEIYGDGFGATIFTSTCTNNTFNITNGTSYVYIHDLKLTRTGSPAISGQDGIHCNTICDYANIDKVWIDNHYNDFRLAGASFNKLQNSIANNAQNHGIYVTNADGCQGLQWSLINNLSQQSNGDGVRWEAVTCTSSTGEIINQATFANLGKGVRLLGTSGAIILQGPRIIGGFFGQDCDDEIYMDTFSTSTERVENAEIEIAGTTACGVNQGTTATHVGHGINLTVNNNVTELVGNSIVGNSYSGINSNANYTVVSSNAIFGNGAAAVSGKVSGIQINAGVGIINGNLSTSQTNGISLTGDGHVVKGNNVTGNSNGIVSVSALTTSDISSNIGAEFGVVRSPQGAVTLANGLNSNIGVATGQYSYLRASGPTGAFSIGGFTGGAAGQVLRITNAVSQTMSIINEDASSTAANRIATLTGGTVVLSPSANSSATFVYDSTSSRWILTSISPDGAAWTTYTPSFSCGTGTITTSTITGRYKIFGKTVQIEVNLVDTTNGTCATDFVIGLPSGVTAASNSPFAGEDFNIGKALAAAVSSGGTTMSVFLYDSTFPGVSGHTYAIGGVLEQQ